MKENGRSSETVADILKTEAVVLLLAVAAFLLLFAFAR
jgi:hypothetical protein